MSGGPIITCFDEKDPGGGWWSNAIPGVTGPPDLDLEAAERLKAAGWRVIITPDPEEA